MQSSVFRFYFHRFLSFFFPYSYIYIHSGYVRIFRSRFNGTSVWRINRDFFRIKVHRPDRGTDRRAGTRAGPKGVVKKNLLVAMDIRRVEYPGGFFVSLLFYFYFIFFACPVSSRSLLTRPACNPSALLHRSRSTVMCTYTHIYMYIIHTHTTKTIPNVSMAENYAWRVFFFFKRASKTRLINRSVLV